MFFQSVVLLLSNTFTFFVLWGKSVSSIFFLLPTSTLSLHNFKTQKERELNGHPHILKWLQYIAKVFKIGTRIYI